LENDTIPITTYHNSKTEEISYLEMTDPIMLLMLLKFVSFSFYATVSFNFKIGLDKKLKKYSPVKLESATHFSHDAKKIEHKELVDTNYNN